MMQPHPPAVAVLEESEREEERNVRSGAGARRGCRDAIQVVAQHHNVDRERETAPRRVLQADCRRHHRCRQLKAVDRRARAGVAMPERDGGGWRGVLRRDARARHARVGGQAQRWAASVPREGDGTVVANEDGSNLGRQLCQRRDARASRVTSRCARRQRPC